MDVLDAERRSYDLESLAAHVGQDAAAVAVELDALVDDGQAAAKVLKGVARFYSVKYPDLDSAFDLAPPKAPPARAAAKKAKKKR